MLNEKLAVIIPKSLKDFKCIKLPIDAFPNIFNFSLYL